MDDKEEFLQQCRLVTSSPLSGLRKQLPLVSIGLPTFNSNGKIVRTLLSLKAQNYPNLEIIVSDNCSTDDTQEIFSSIIKILPGIRYYRQSCNIGLNPNFEFVLKQAKGEFFMWIADDDRLEPGILHKYVDFLVIHPEYSLVSGEIKYWLRDRPIFFEKDFSIEESQPDIRAAHYYSKVMYGAIFHGLMHRRTAEMIPLRNGIGNDFHFVASLAFLGKIKQFDLVGYNKELNGSSKDSIQYARAIGASWMSAHLPRFIIARDAFNEVLFKSPIYRKRNFIARFILATTCFTGVLVSYYGREYPFIIGGQIKRRLNPFGFKFGSPTPRSKSFHTW
ncbi:hypothetical protein BH09BAC3_BH09BAC3_10270 [soil metagenome]